MKSPGDLAFYLAQHCRIRGTLMKVISIPHPHVCVQLENMSTWCADALSAAEGGNGSG